MADKSKIRRVILMNGDIADVVEMQKERSFFSFNQLKEKTMFDTVSNDVSGFFTKHKKAIYFLAVSIVIDHFIFKGKFRERIQRAMDQLLGRVEKMIDKEGKEITPALGEEGDKK